MNRLLGRLLLLVQVAAFLAGSFPKPLDLGLGFELGLAFGECLRRLERDPWAGPGADPPVLQDLDLFGYVGPSGQPIGIPSESMPCFNATTRLRKSSPV